MPKTIRLNATHYFIMKIPKKREFQQIASNHSSDTIEENKAQCNLLQSLLYHQEMSVNINFLKGKDVLPEKDLLEKAATIK